MTNIDLEKINLMTATEASELWGFARNYVTQKLKNNPDKAKEIEGSYEYVGKSNSILLITGEGMEKLTEKKTVVRKKDTINLKKLELMTATEASERWGYDRNYVTQTLKNNPDKAREIEGLYEYVGKSNDVLLITEKGMEKLTGKPEKELASNLKKLELMTASEASERWGFSRNYIGVSIIKYPEKFKKIKGLYKYVGNDKSILLITREGMEKLTGKPEIGKGNQAIKKDNR